MKSLPKPYAKILTSITEDEAISERFETLSDSKAIEKIGHSSYGMDILFPIGWCFHKLGIPLIVVGDISDLQKALAGDVDAYVLDLSDEDNAEEGLFMYVIGRPEFDRLNPTEASLRALITKTTDQEIVAEAKAIYTTWAKSNTNTEVAKFSKLA